MNVSLVLTVLGDDKPGLVESVAGVVAQHEGNWLESRMSRLAGKFAGVIRVEVPQARADAMTAALADLEPLHVLVERGEAGGNDESVRTLTLELVGADRPGIVQQISHTLAARGINVDELTTEISNAPMSGDSMFKVSAQLRVGPDLSVPQLQGALEHLANELMVDIQLNAS